MFGGRKAFIALGLHAELGPGSFGNLDAHVLSPLKTPPKKKNSEPASTNEQPGCQSPTKDQVAPKRLNQARAAVFVKAKTEPPVLKAAKPSGQAPKVDPNDLVEQDQAVGKPSASMVSNARRPRMRMSWMLWLWTMWMIRIGLKIYASFCIYLLNSRNPLPCYP